MNILNVKRKILNYEMLKYDLEESETLAKEYYEIFVNEIFPDQYNDLFIDNDDENEHKEDDEEDIEIEPSENLKKIYRKLSLKVHPDRNTNLQGDEKIENEELFKNILESYQNHNLCDLLVKARELRISIPELLPEDVQIVEKNIKTMQEKIEKIKNQMSWVWCTTTNPHIKERIKRIVKESIESYVSFNWIIEEPCECAICLENMEIGRTERRLICGHIFHKTCIMSWFKIKFICPLCRMSFE